MLDRIILLFEKLYMKKLNKLSKKAFTLVELIIVISILAILWVIAFLSYEWYNASSRDSVRTSDLNSIKKSIDIYIAQVWKWPQPSNWTWITYSWGLVWTQWTFGKSVQQIVWNISPLPVDPLYNVEYTYSLLNDNKQFEVAWIYENDWSFALNDNLKISDTTYAFWWKNAYAQILWNYNWIAIKVQTWSMVFVLALPSIVIWDTSITKIEDIISWNYSVSYNKQENLPSSYKNLNLSMTWESFSFTPSLVWSWASLSELGYDSRLRVFTDNLKNTYSQNPILKWNDTYKILVNENSWSVALSDFWKTIALDILKSWKLWWSCEPDDDSKCVVSWYHCFSWDNICYSNNPGWKCDTNSECTSNYCVSNICTTKPVWTACSANIECSSSNCDTAWSHLCIGNPNGASCSANNNCASGICTSNICEWKPDGANCWAASECSSNLCNVTCRKPDWSTCSADQDCNSNACWDDFDNTWNKYCHSTSTSCIDFISVWNMQEFINSYILCSWNSYSKACSSWTWWSSATPTAASYCDAWWWVNSWYKAASTTCTNWVGFAPSSCTSCWNYKASSTSSCYTSCVTNDDSKCINNYHCFSWDNLCYSNSNWQKCDTNAECGSNLCSANVCQAPPVDCSNASHVCGNSCTYNDDTYSTVQIWTQCWFAENLRTIKYPNGTAITKWPTANNAAGWSDSTTAYYSCPPNISNNWEDCAAAWGTAKLGMLYQWKTLMNGSSGIASGNWPQWICPSGWQIPTNDGTASSGLGKLISHAYTTCGASNEGACLKIWGATGFNVLLSGYRWNTWAYGWRSASSYIFSSSSVFGWNARYQSFSASNLSFYDYYEVTKAFSVRCLKN